MRSNMRVWVGIAVALAAVAILAAIAFAAQSPDREWQTPATALATVGHHMMGMGAMYPGMMDAMAGRSAITASDKAAHVLSGNKLSGYKLNLRLPRQGEIKADLENAGMHRMIEECYEMMGGNHHLGAMASPAPKSEDSSR